MLICELFKSIQGEGKFSGFPCSFIRVSGCNLDCSYCDTKFARQEFISFEIEDIVKRIAEFQTRLILITGGEPLLQPESIELSNQLLQSGKQVMIETNGTCDISVLPENVHIIMDIKTPGSKMSEHNNYSNLNKLKAGDEIKFVVTDKVDFEWVIEKYSALDLDNFQWVSVTPAFNQLKSNLLADWIVESGLNLRLNLQIHKILWGDERER